MNKPEYRPPTLDEILLRPITKEEIFLLTQKRYDEIVKENHGKNTTHPDGANPLGTAGAGEAGSFDQ